MSTTRIDDVAELLLGRTRAEVLSILYLEAAPSMYIREIARAIDGSPGTIQRELRNLESLGLILREERGNQVYYRPDPNHPIHDDLRRILIKTTGVAARFKEALEPLEKSIRVAFLYGSMARGDHTSMSDVDLMVIGDVTFRQVSDHLLEAEQELRREVNPTVYPLDEFQEKLQSGHHFLTSVVEGEKTMLIGGEDELRGLAGESLAD